jgi:membrane-associated phospholipid phosphatase
VSRLAPRRPRLAAAGIVSVTALAVLVGVGALTRLDQFAVSHVMPWLHPRKHAMVTLRGLVLPRLHGPAAHLVLELFTYPAAFLPSLLLVLFAVRRLPRSEGVAWCGVWLAGNAVELAGKLTLVRPALFHHHVHVTTFDSSLPSGHTIRAFVVAGVVAACWTRGRFAYAWAAAVAPTLVVSGAHTPTDVAAGICVYAALAAWAPRPRADQVSAELEPNVRQP